MTLPTSRHHTRRQSPAAPSSPDPFSAREPASSFMDEMQVHAAEAARMLKVLAHENRLLVMCHLSGGELSVGEINERIPLSQSALSQHLAVLRGEGLVVTRRQGHSIFYRLAETGASQILAVLHDLYCGSAEERA